MHTSNRKEELCVNCGFCCDKTLFDFARVFDEEKLPFDFKEMESIKDGVNSFSLPCKFFDGACTIYDQDKPQICGKFECQVLNRFEAGEETFKDSMKTISDSKKTRDGLIEEYAALTNTANIPFRDLFTRSQTDSEFEENDDLRTLKFRIGLFEIGLSKIFKSDKEFENTYQMKA